MEIKEQIINAAIDLIKETNGSIDKITIRQIAKRAGVGVGLINYHFQSNQWGNSSIKTEHGEIIAYGKIKVFYKGFY